MSIQKWTKRKDKAITEGNLQELFNACSELGALHMGCEEYDNALAEYKEAKNAAQAANNSINVARIHRAIGDIYSCMQRHDLAIKNGLKYLELARVLGDTVEEQRALANLGHMYLTKADTFTNPDSSEKFDTLQKAKKYSLLSLQVCEKLTNVNRKELVEMQARLYLNLGLSVELSDENEAINYYNKAISLCKSMDIWGILYQTYHSLGSLQHQRANHAAAVHQFDRALDAAQRLHDTQRICLILQLKAEVLFDLPDFRGAKQCLLKAYKLKTANRDEVERKLRTVAAVNCCEEKLVQTPEYDLVTKKSLYETLGDGCVSMNNYTKALEYYYLMLETAKNMGESGEQLRPCYVSLSQTYRDNKQYDMAIKYFREELALNSNNPVEAFKTTINIAEVLETKEAPIDEVLEMYESARQFAQTANNHRLEAQAVSAAVQALKQHNRISESRKMESELENLKEKFGPFLSGSESEGEEENTPDIGADINIDELSDIDQEEQATVRTRKKNPATKFRRNEKGEFPLHTACINGNLTLVTKLLEQGHPVNVRDHGGWLPLHEACNYGYVEIVTELLDHGAAINDRGSDVCEGMTPLLDAASCGQLEVMRLLLQRGASPTMRNNKGESVLDCLLAWRERFIKDENQDLDPETLSQFTELKKTLKAALKKAGQKPETERRSPSPILGSFPSRRHKSTLSQSDFRGANSAFRHSTGNDDLPKRNHFNEFNQLQKSSRRSIDDEDLTLRRSSSNRESLSNSSNNSLRRSSEGISVSRNTNATREYEDAIKSLRRKPVVPSPSPLSPEKSALVDEGEVVDDWLVDDVGTGSSNRGVKRRWTALCEGESLRRASRPAYRPLSPLGNLSDSNHSEPNQEMELTGQNENSSDVSELGFTQEVTPIQATATQQSSVLNQSTSASALRSRYQVPLSVFGVVRSQVEPVGTERPPAPVAVPLPASQPPPPTQLTAQSSAPSQVAPLSVKVRVEGKLLLIPLPAPSEEPPTVAWLAEEAAKRYYSFEGVEPKLTLTTEDGALLAPQDPVTLLLSCREVTALVSGWHNHPLTHRYREACQQLATEADEYLERCLDVTQASCRLDMGNCGLTGLTAEPVLRACLHQSTLQHLELSDNRLGDTGIQHLARLVVKLPHLRTLDLRCNGITSEGLNFFVHQVVEHQACKRLETLKLCHNRLGSSSVSLLSRLLSVTAGLTELSLASTGLTGSSLSPQYSLALENIERLDLSCNALGGEGVASLLKRLSPHCVESLRLAHAGAQVVGRVAQWLASSEPGRLRLLDLAYCSDQPAEFSQLIRALEKAPLLEQLELSCDALSDEPSLLQALYKLPLKKLRLPGVGVPRAGAPPPPTLQLSCLSLGGPPPPWALQAPGGLITTHTAR